MTQGNYQKYLTNKIAVLMSSFEKCFRKKMYESLLELGIPCTLILDSATGYIMEKVDMVMVGAEGVAESGGIINKVNSRKTISNQLHLS